MSETDIPKAYDPKAWEDDLYRKWEESGFFNPDKCIEKGVSDSSKPSFSIVLPPPNVTGHLHAGHAAMLAIEDTIVRYHRMKGERTLWLPGTDHAAVATQSKVEDILWKEEGKTRYDFSREDFLARLEAFAQESHDRIRHQIEKLGSSVDWSREAYTLDDARSLAVRTAFKRMYDDGLIYRGYRTVNWSVKGQSTCSDDELVYVDRKATLFTFRYSKDFPIAIATTRPETKLGDTAVAVHPDDDRYREFVGKTYEISSFAGGPELSIRIIADEMVDPAFGTGAVGITPAHSHTDHDFYVRHKDEVAFAPEGGAVIGTDGNMTPATGPAYAGLGVIAAREKVVSTLREAGLIEREEDIDQSVGTSDRFKDVIEVVPMRQWFVDVNKEFEPARNASRSDSGRRDGRKASLKQLMREAVSSGRVTILPDRFAKTYFHWIDNLRDWCISRQIWFGHRIPVYYCKRSDTTQDAGDKEKCAEPIVSIGQVERCPFCGGEVEQDPDTLDTWFSSGLWTFSTLGWPWKKEWSLKIYDGEQIFEAIENGTKRFETRAGKPESADKDWRQFNVGDIVKFSLIEEGTERLLSEKVITREIVSIRHFDSVDDLLANIDVKEVHPHKPEEYRDWWESRPVFRERIQKYGIWAFELKEPDLLAYHPTNLLETGYDILFFWVARMILMTEYLLGTHPFDTVYLHGLVRDAEGRKMSKSLGNIIDPLDVSELHGADALRMALMSGSTPGNDVKLSDEKIVAMRNFTNKLWNLARYVGTISEATNAAPEAESDADRDLVRKLETIVADITRHLDRYELSLAAEELRAFTWDDFADWYVEVHKIEGNDALLSHAFDTILRLWHPFMPFVTEAIHRTLRLNDSEFLMIAKWPVFESTHKTIADENRFELVKDLIVKIRAIRAAYRIDPTKRMIVSVRGASERTIRDNEEVFRRLARVEEVRTFGADIPEHSILIQSGLLQAFLHLEGVIDIEKETARLKDDLAQTERYAAALQTKLGNPSFVDRAPKEIVGQARTLLDEALAKADTLRGHIASLS